MAAVTCRGLVHACGAVALMLAAGCASDPLSPDELHEMSRTAVLSYESGEAAKAEALYRGLARAAPYNPETWLRLGNLYARTNRPEEAASAYQRSLQLNPGDARTWYNLGLVRQRQAYILFLQANHLTDKDDPLHSRVQALVKQLEAQQGAAGVVDAESKPKSGKDADPSK